MAFREFTDEEIFGIKKANTDINNQPKKTANDVINDVKTNLKKVGNTGYNFVRSIGQGATFGQGSHLAGLGQAYGSTLYDILHGNKPKFADIAKDYTEGRENFKKEYKDFEDKNKALAFAGEMLGGLGTGVSSGVLKGISLTKKPLLSAIGSGTGIGALYGASNTEGKGIDLKNAGIGAGLGAGLGLGLVGGGKLAKFGIDKLINNKTIKDVANAYKKGAENTFTPYIKEKGQLSGNSIAYQVGDNDIPSELLNIMAKHGKDKKFLNEVANNSNFSKKFEVYRDDLVSDLKGFISSLKKKAEDMYKPYNKQQVPLTFNDGKNNVNVVDLLEKRLEDYKVNAPTSSGKENIIKQAEETIADFKKRYMKTEVIKPQTTTTYFSEGTIPENYISETIVTKNEIPFKNLQDEMKKIWEIQDNIKYYDNTILKYDVEKGGEQGVRLLNDFYSILKQARDSVIPKKVSQYYANTMMLSRREKQVK